MRAFAIRLIAACGAGHGMSLLRIASLLPDALNQRLHERLPEAEIVAVAADELHRITADTQVLLGFPKDRRLFPVEAVPGWPLGLTWIHLASSGTDGYPLWFFADGLPISNSRGVSARAVSEYALAAIFAQAKRIPDIWVRDREQWQNRKLGQIKGSTLGLLGFGSIGKTLAGLALALGMRVLALRQSGPADVPGVVTARDIHALFAESDHLVLALPSTARTRHIVDAAVLASAKPGLHLINVARGALIDDMALLRALDDGRIAHATLDVTEPEPLPAGHAFYRHPAVSLSAHVSATMADAHDQLVELIVRNVQNHLHGRPYENRIH